MTDREILADKVADVLRARGWKMRTLAKAADLPDNAVQRILERPERGTYAETWVKLARALGWDVRETLRLAGYEWLVEAVTAGATEPAEPMEMIERGLGRLPLTEEAKGALRFMLRQSLEEHRSQPMPRPGAGSTDG